MEQQPLPEEELILPTAIFPAPPPFWKSFTTENLSQLSTLESTSTPLDAQSLPLSLLPLIPPPPPPPDQSHYYTFHSSNALHPVPVRPTDDELLFSTSSTDLTHPQNSPQLRSIIVRLIQSLLLKFLELVAVLGTNPSEWADEMTDVSTLYRNLAYALNLYRPHQARVGVRQMLRRRLEEGRREVERCEEVVRRGEELLREVAGWSSEDGMAQREDNVEGQLNGMRRTNGVNGTSQLSTDQELERKRELWQMMNAVEPD